MSVTQPALPPPEAPPPQPAVVLEHVLRAVAMVNVPVYDEHPQPNIVGVPLGVTGSQRRRVEEAEAAWCVALSVVARWTDNGHAVAHLPARSHDMAG